MSKQNSKAAKRRAMVVLGMHRSGTSALTGVLECLGCTMPRRLMKPMPDNPRGFFESRPVADLDDAILEAAGSQWSDWISVADWMAEEGVAGFTDSAAEVLEEEFGDAPVIALKDPRMCLTFPVWKAALRRAGFAVSVVLTHRQPVEVAQSLQRRNALSPAHSYLLWLRHVLEAERATRGLERVFTSYDRLMRDGLGEAERIGNALGIGAGDAPETGDRAAEIGALIEPGLRHFDLAAAGAGTGAAELHGWIKDTFAVAEQWAASGEQVKGRRVFDRVRRAFDTAAPAFHGLTEVENLKDLGSRLARAEGTARQEADGHRQARERAEAWRETVQGEGGLEAQLKAARQRIAGLNAALEEARNKEEDTVRLRADLDEMVVRATALQSRLETQDKDLAAARSTLHASEAKREQQAAEAARLRDELERRDRQGAGLRRQLDDLRAEAETARVARRNLTAQLAAQGERNAGQAAELAAIRAEKAQADEALEQAEHRVRAVEASTSWRITAPLRAVVDRLRGREKH